MASPSFQTRRMSSLPLRGDASMRHNPGARAVHPCAQNHGKTDGSSQHSRPTHCPRFVRVRAKRTCRSFVWAGIVRVPALEAMKDRHGPAPRPPPWSGTEEGQLYRLLFAHRKGGIRRGRINLSGFPLSVPNTCCDSDLDPTTRQFGKEMLGVEEVDSVDSPWPRAALR
jgi:hypothetical protein